MIIILLMAILINCCCCTVVSYNLPKFSPCVTWNPNAIIFAENQTLGLHPYSVFVDINNTVYGLFQKPDSILIWAEDDTNVTEAIYDLEKPNSIFVSTDGNIYVDNNTNVGHRVDKWTLNATDSVLVMNVTSQCYSLFIDVNNTLYCSNDNEHKVVKMSLNNNSKVNLTAAGNGYAGSEAHMLNQPKGIFVDFNLSLYVADHINDRIQLFEHGQLNGTTVAGKGGSVTVKLNRPSGLILDADGNLFISDQNNNRIIRVGQTDFRCLVGCSEIGGSLTSQLNQPKTISFDSYGNIFAVDSNNSRILKFSLFNNSCAVSYNQLSLSPCASWDQKPTISTNCSSNGNKLPDIFVDANNTIYVASRQDQKIVVCSSSDSTPLSIISIGSSSDKPPSLFVTTNGYIYVNDDKFIHRINKSTNSSVIAANVSNICNDLFIDFENTLYCSMSEKHKVVKLLLEYQYKKEEVVAGNGTNESTSYSLNNPIGIFVDTELNLYVADSGNHRIQLFRHGSTNGTTVAGNKALGNEGLNFPTGIVLDADGYLFIADCGNRRIIRSEIDGFRCVIGCFEHESSHFNPYSHQHPHDDPYHDSQLHGPQALWFDDYGNMFVLDDDNQNGNPYQVQKFHLSTNSCGMFNKIEFDYEYHLTSFETLDHLLLTTPFEKERSLYFFIIEDLSSHPKALACWSLTRIGFYCEISSTKCDLLQPCQSNGTCYNIDDEPRYNCSCIFGFNGSECEQDYRVCKPDTCWNNSTCNESSTAPSPCTCAPGWEGRNCEIMENYCYEGLCKNNGVCRPILGDYFCECLNGSYSGRNCEETEQRIIIIQTASKSLSYIAIIALVIVAMFFITMDILHYCFGINPVEKERKRMQHERRVKRQKHIAAKASKNKTSWDGNTLIRATL